MIRSLSATIFVLFIVGIALAVVQPGVDDDPQARGVRPDSITIAMVAPDVAGAWERGGTLHLEQHDMQAMQVGDSLHMCYVRWFGGKPVPLKGATKWGVEGHMRVGSESATAPLNCRWLVLIAPPPVRQRAL